MVKNEKAIKKETDVSMKAKDKDMARIENKKNHSLKNKTSGEEKPKAFTIKYKRPRGSRACVVCRSRKVRCDAEIHIPCTNCITFGCECTLPEAKKRGNGSVEAKRQKSNSEKNEESNKPGEQFQNKRPAVVIPSSGLGSDKIGAMYSSQSVLNISQVSVAPSSGIHKKQPRRNIGGRSSITFLGSSSIGAVAQKVGQTHLELSEDLYEEEETSLDSIEFEILKLRGAFLLPSHDISLDLINSYFEHVHPLMPVINRSEFMRKFEDPNDNPSLMLMQAVLLCGCRVSANKLLLDSKGSTKLACLTFFGRAKALYEAGYESNPISIIQTLILIGSYGEGPEDVTKNSFYWTKIAISLAQGFGFHRDINNSTTISATEKKIWRRIWWCLFEKDRNVAIAFGRPSSIDLNDCDVPMLTLDDFDEDEPSIVSPYPIKRTEALYFIHLVKLAEITGIIIKSQYTVKAEKSKSRNKLSVIQHCDMLMGVWFSNLPPELVLSLSDPSTQNFYSCLLNAQYYNRLYLIHRSNLIKMAKSGSANPNNYKYPSWGISFQAARMISILSKFLLDRNEIKYCPVMFIYIVFTALVMLIYHIDSNNQAVSTTASDSLFILRAMMRELAKYWPMAKVLFKLFDKYANDKIKRANLIERGNQIAELQESEFKSSGQMGYGVFYTEHADAPSVAGTPSLQQNSMAIPFSGDRPIVNSPPSVNSGVSPRGSVYVGVDEPEAQNNKQQEITHILEATNNKSFDKQSSGKSADKSPSSISTFPDISLVTESLPKNSNFFQNFEPTQLFPDKNFSLPPTRRQSFSSKSDVKALGNADVDFNGSGTYGNSSAANSNNGNKLLNTNFMDSYFTNMNIPGGESGFLNDDINNLFNISL